MGKKQLSHQQIAQLCRGFALLLHAGVNTCEGAFWLAEQAPANQKNLLTQIGQALEEGMPLSDCLALSGAFPAHVCALVRSGEVSGRLEEALDSLAQYFEERSRIGARLKNAVAYPSMLFVLMMAVIGVLLTRVLPVFDEVYASLGGGLTGAAKGLLQLGMLLRQALPALLCILAAALICAAILALIPGLRERAKNWFSKHFGDRGISRRYNNARFAQVLAMGLRSGLPTEDTLKLAGDILADRPGATARFHHCTRALEEGKDLPQAMVESGFLSQTHSRLFSLGLRGGSGETVMENIARELQQQADDALDAAVSKAEPAMVLTGSLLVGFILLSVMLPLMNILSSLG